jgi:hypothetical protein
VLARRLPLQQGRRVITVDLVPLDGSQRIARCQFDEGAYDLGLHWLQEERDETRGVWKDRLRHDDASHGADTFLTFACSGYQPPSALPTRKRSFGWAV